MTMRGKSVQDLLFENLTNFEDVSKTRLPVVVRKCNIGTCREKWTAEYLIHKVGNQNIKIHVSSESKMNFVTKNFLYKTLPFAELVTRAAESTHTNYFLNATEYYYLRSLGTDSRGRDIADFKTHYPLLAEDLVIPNWFDQDDFFSSVLRVSSANVCLWTHFDIMDNILIQVTGRKRMVLWPPGDALNLYLSGDKSLVVDIDNPDLEQFPKFAEADRYECVLEPGDILFIPALWFHNATALDFGIAVNVFWRHLQCDLYDKKDPYGNKDLLPGAKALQMVGNAVKSLDVLPRDYKDFYLKRMISILESKLKNQDEVEESST